LSGSESVQVLFIVYLHLYCLRDLSIKGVVGISLTGLILPYFCMYECMLGPVFPTSSVVVIFVFNDLRGEVIVRFADIGGIFDQHSLSILFIN